MTPSAILILIIIYFGTLFYISHRVSRKDGGNDAFFTANKNSKWYLVAFGMIGTALSGVTFISVPGEVGAASGEQFKYFQFVLGNAIGFIIITKLLLPLYYRMNLTSIYEYIKQRMGVYSYKTSASIFLISRTVSSAFRLYLVVIVLQRFVFDYYNIPFALTVLLSLLLIFSYTYKGGLKTIIITDTLQTFFLVTSVFLTIYFICDSMNLSAISAFNEVRNSDYSQIFFFDDFLGSKFHFIKQILGGMFVTIAMTGLDQDLMQKNLSCKNIGEAQKNMFTFTGIFVLINIFFLSVGALLYIYAEKNGIAVPVDLITGKPRTDLLFPEIALNHLSIIPAIIFLLGIIAATFATTDSALTALTTSFCVDFLDMDKGENSSKKNTVRTRHFVHLSFSALVFLVILIFDSINDSSVVGMIFKVASYTYGPLLGLYAFGLFQKTRNVNDKLVPFICLLAPFLTYLINENSKVLFSGYVFDNELIVLNGLLTYLGLYITSSHSNTKISF